MENEYLAMTLVNPTLGMSGHVYISTIISLTPHLFDIPMPEPILPCFLRMKNSMKNSVQTNRPFTLSVEISLL